jgi:hypothetical protein
MLRTADGTLVLYFMGDHPADPGNKTCSGNQTAPTTISKPVLRPCKKSQTPTNDHCICSPEVEDRCAGASGGLYLAKSASKDWPDGPWEVSYVDVQGPGWEPYNSTLRSIGHSNPAAAVMQDGRILLSFRSHRGYWPSIHPQHGDDSNHEHTGFGIADSFEGPFQVTGNLSWQYGNDEDPFVWQQPDGTLHCLYHNGRGNTYVNNGLHAFSRDGIVWHKAADATSEACMTGPPFGEECTALYTNILQLSDGSTETLIGRERPTLLFDLKTGAPTHLFNGAIPAAKFGSDSGDSSGGHCPHESQNVQPWYAMVQAISNE